MAHSKQHAEEESIDVIRTCAFELLMEKGYTKTSYTDIATRSGKTRALVQYYYPKKEALLSEFMLRLLELSEAYMDEHNLRTNSWFLDFSITGYVYFNTLLANENLHPLTRDITAHRSASASVIELMQSWVVRYDEVASLAETEILEGLLFSIGGAHELISYQLNAGSVINVPALLKQTILSFMFQCGFDTCDFSQHFDERLLSCDVLADANEYVLSRMCTG